MERKSIGEFGITCKVFLWKIAKEKQFYWKKNLCYSLLPIVLVLLPLALIDKLDQREETISQNEIFEPETEVSRIALFVCQCIIILTPYFFRKIYIRLIC
jgi:hypothetical protein